MNISDYIISIRRYLHMYPEIGYDTFKTQAFISKELDKLNISNTKTDFGAVLAKIDLNKEKTIAFRADIDALEIKEQNDVVYKSTNNYMHACGHDCHCAILLGFAKILTQNLDQLNVNIVLIFQNAEEGPLPGGAIKLIESNILKNVSDFYALHVTNKLKINTIGLKRNEAFAAPDLFEGFIKTSGGHAAYKNEITNPCEVISSITLAFEEYYKKVIKTWDVVITTTFINAGNTKNVISNCGSFGGTARSFNNEIRHKLKNDLEQIFNKIISEYNCEGTFNFMFAYDPLINNEELVNKVIEIVDNTKRVTPIILNEKELVGEDFSYYQRIGNILLIWFGTNNNTSYIPLHNPKFDVCEESLYQGAYLFLDIALSYK